MDYQQVLVNQGGKEKLLHFLKHYKNEFFKSHRLASICGFSTKGTNAELRKTITELILKDLQPIISSKAGYCWTDCEMLKLDYIRNLRSRVRGIENRIKALQRSK